MTTVDQVAPLEPAAAVQPVGVPLDPASSVTVTITNTDRDVGPLPIPVQSAGPNHVTTDDMQIPFSGNWRLEIDALFGQFDQTTFTTTFHAS